MGTFQNPVQFIRLWPKPLKVPSLARCESESESESEVKVNE